MKQEQHVQTIMKWGFTSQGTWQQGVNGLIKWGFTSHGTLQQGVNGLIKWGFTSHGTCQVVLGFASNAIWQGATEDHNPG
jgi:hypothetical protein